MDDLPFIIEERDIETDKILQVIARTSNARVGRAAFEAACEHMPAARICYRQKARVISVAGISKGQKQAE